MKKPKTDDLRSEYSRKNLGRGVRGKYLRSYRKGMNRVCKFVLCIKNDDCDDLELLKVYQVLTDKKVSQKGHLRVVDESGENYLYPELYFAAVTLSPEAQDVLLAVGGTCRPLALKGPRCQARR